MDKREGDVLGISDARGRLPNAPPDDGGHPEGIEIEPPSNTSDVPQGPGATSIDMGSGGEGHAIKRR